MSASPGIAIGKIFLMSSAFVKVEKRLLAEEEIDQEIEKFLNAVENAKKDLQILQKQTAESLGDESARIFEAHQLMLQDELIIEESVRRIREKKTNSDFVFFEIMEKLESSLGAASDEYLSARVADLRDVKKRVVHNIQGKKKLLHSQLIEPSIIISKELTPSDTINLKRSHILGFATDLGGRTSHAALMARSLKVPSVVGLHDCSQFLEPGDLVVLDGNEGILVINPSPNTIQKYQKRLNEYIDFEKKLEHLDKLPTRTKDCKDVELVANIEFLDEVEQIKKLGARGIGLFRTEYLYLAKSELPTEEEQFQEYKQIVEKLGDHPVTIRTFDLGGDKVPESIRLPKEENPFLGVRAIRIAMSHNVAMFKTQLRAILRASAFGKIRILFPMISCVSEMRYCQKVLEEVKNDLSEKGISFSKNIPVGAMIEVPSAAVIADLIAEECDFLSIGTNDLIQYVLAVDRGNEHVAYLYHPFNPAVLRLIREIIQKGHQKGVWVAMCGEMASDPLATMVLLGLGLDEFSVSQVSLLLIKEIIRRVDYSECESLANKALSFTVNNDVEAYLKRVMHNKFKDLKITL